MASIYVREGWYCLWKTCGLISCLIRINRDIWYKCDSCRIRWV